MITVRYQPHHDPFVVNASADDIERFFKKNGKTLLLDKSIASSSHWSPAIDVKESAKHFVVCADIPGVKPEDLHISCKNSALAIQGKRALREKEKMESYSRIERESGEFYRQLDFSSRINIDAVKAKCKNGVLELYIPKIEEVTRSKFKVLLKD